MNFAKKWSIGLGAFGTGFDIGMGIFNTIQQKKALQYSREMQERQWQREDTAVQRRVADLSAAGLSKTLAVGSAAGSSSFQPVTPAQYKTSLLDRISAAQQLQMNQATIKKTEGEAMNEVIRGEVLGSQAQLNLAQVSLSQAQTVLAWGNWELLGIKREQGEAMVAKARAETEHELLKMGYTRAQINKLGAETVTEYLRQDYTKAQTYSTNQYTRLLTEKVAGQIMMNRQEEMKSSFMARTGMHMPTYATGLMGMAGNFSAMIGNAGSGWEDRFKDYQ